MNKSATSLFVFGVYLFGMGASFVFIPNTLLSMLSLPPTNEVWCRVVGVLAFVLAFYYMQAARTNLRSFAAWTVPTRIVVFLFFTGFVLMGWVGPIMIGLGAVDLLGALWTGWALRTEESLS